ncbi:MAG: type II toxin-antitoxin system RelE/ParE family toxin [Planctomycetes bacterium]|nr:type II toxin-antitoxin system RelE/ParE family toxin [Planctomycetota bacterium]
MKYDVVLTSKAKCQLDEACAWYAVQNADVADVWYDGFVEVLISLESNPQRHGLAPENDAFPVELRQLSYGSGRRKTHRALFVIRPDKVVVHAIRHLAQQDITLDDL